MKNKINTDKIKTIIIMILSVMLSLTLAFNIFILTILEIKDIESFKQVLLCRELVESLNSIEQSPTVETDSSVDTSIEPPENTPTVDTMPIETKVVYAANNIKITYVRQEETLFGPSLKFYVENNSGHIIDINFTDVFINDWLSSMSGGYCSELTNNKYAYVSLTLWESEYQEFTNNPEKIEFTINIITYNAAGLWTSIEESDSICITLN